MKPDNNSFLKISFHFQTFFRIFTFTFILSECYNFFFFHLFVLPCVSLFLIRLSTFFKLLFFNFFLFQFSDQFHFIFSLLRGAFANFYTLMMKITASIFNFFQNDTK